MKKIFISLITSMLILSLAGCGSEDNSVNTSVASNSAESTVVSMGETEQTAERESEQTVEKESEQTAEKEVTAEVETTVTTPEVLFESFSPIDNDECSVTIKELDPDNIWGYTVKVGLENKSPDKTLMFSVTTAFVNGVEADPYFATEVAPGKKSNDEISFTESGLNENGITDFTDIEIIFRVYDSNDWSADDVANETFHIYPYGEDKATRFVREQQANDQVLVDDDNVTVLITDKGQDPIWGYTLKVFILNKSDTEIMVSVEEAAINGYMADPFFAKSVQPGKCAFTSMSWSDSSLEENDISEIEEIEFKLRVYDWNDWSADDFFNDVVTVKP